MTPNEIGAIIRDPDDPRYPTQVVVFCDRCRVELAGDYLVHADDDQHTRFGYARARARSLGWRCDETGDLCPRCAALPAPILRSPDTEHLADVDGVGRHKPVWAISDHPHRDVLVCGYCEENWPCVDACDVADLLERLAAGVHDAGALKTWTALDVEMLLKGEAAALYPHRRGAPAEQPPSRAQLAVQLAQVRRDLEDARQHGRNVAAQRDVEVRENERLRRALAGHLFDGESLRTRDAVRVELIAEQGRELERLRAQQRTGESR